MKPRILVAGVGNVFLGDDGFGVEVVRRLAIQTLPSEVLVVDIGIRTLHLAYALLDQPELLVVVDAVQRGDSPGTLTLMQPTELDQPGGALPDAHGANLRTVLAALRSLGGTPPPVLLVGCEPESTDGGMKLSPAVEHAVERAQEMVHALIARELVVETRAVERRTS